MQKLTAHHFFTAVKTYSFPPTYCNFPNSTNFLIEVIDTLGAVPPVSHKEEGEENKNHIK